MKPLLLLAFVSTTLLLAVGCSRRGPSPAQKDSSNDGGAGKANKSSKETIENGLNVYRVRYESANKYTPEHSATLVSEYEKLRKADPSGGPKAFWDKYGNQKTVLEVEGVIESIGASQPKEEFGKVYVMVDARVSLKGWPQPKTANVQFASASMAIRSLRKGQNVTVRGVLGGFLGENDGSQPPTGHPRMFFCQLVSPKDE